MHVAINAQLLSTAATYRGAGVSNYSRHLLTALGALASADQRQDLTLTAFVNTAAYAAAGIAVDQSRLPLQQPLARIAWEQSILPFLLQQKRADLVHGLVNVLPLTTTIPGVVTVHDLSFVRTPEALPRAKRWYLTQLCRASVHKAVQVIAVSQQTADDLLHYFALSADKISVIHNGIAPHFAPPSPAALAAFRQEQNLPDRYFLYLGTLEPRKNLPFLIRAYARWRESTTASERDIPLILAGGKGWFYDKIFQLVTELDLADDILFPGFIPDEALPLWYGAATAFIYPSYFEGFGLPVLEAMACGTPVLCSDIAPLREVAGDCALYVGVDDEIRLSQYLGEISTDSVLTDELRTAGLHRAAHFSWRRTAHATAALYQQFG